MIDLKKRVQQLIETETQNKAVALCEADWNDSIAYYENEIKSALKAYFELSEDFAQYILDNTDLWPDDAYQYREGSFPHVIEGEFAMAGDDEIYVDKETLKSCGLDTCKPSIRYAINYSTDLYISKKGAGYIDTSYSYVALVFDNLDIDQLKNYHREE